MNLVGWMGASPEFLNSFIDSAVSQAESLKDGSPGDFAAKYSTYLDAIRLDDESNRLGDDQDLPDNASGPIKDAGRLNNADGLESGGGSAGRITIDGDGTNRNSSGLTENEINFIKGKAIMDFNAIMMTNRSQQRVQKKAKATHKEEKKRDAAETEAYLAQIEAQGRAARKEAANRSRKK
jgi:hypothetical protein